MSRSIHPYYSWVLFFLNLLLVAYVSTSGMLSTTFSEKLMAHFNVSSSTLAYSMTSYFYCFGIFLIPVAILIDRYPAQWIIPLGVCVNGLGTILLARSLHINTAIIARSLMGIGATVGLSYAVKCIADWFSAQKFTLVFALFISLKLLITLLFIFSLAHIFQSTAWQQAMFYYGLCSIPLALLIILNSYVTRKHPPPFASTPNIPWGKAVRQLFDSSQIWFIGVATGFFFGILFIFTSKWSNLFFRTVYHIPLITANYLITPFWLGYFVGSLFFSYISTSLKTRKMFIPWGILTTFLMFIIIIYPPYLPINSIMLVFFLFGFASAASFLGYVIIHEQNIPQLTATAIAAINVYFALAIALTDPVVNVFLQLEPITNQASTYSLRDFQVSLFRIPIFVMISFLFSLFIRETRAKQRVYEGSDWPT